MGDFSLSTITPMIVSRWDGFDYPEVAKVTPLLGSAPGTVANAVVQGSGSGYRQAMVSGTIVSATHLATLRTLYLEKTEATFTDDAGTAYTVRVFDLRITKLQVPVGVAWTFSCRLVQTG